MNNKSCTPGQMYLHGAVNIGHRRNTMWRSAPRWFRPSLLKRSVIGTLALVFCFGQMCAPLSGPPENDSDESDEQVLGDTPEIPVPQEEEVLTVIAGSEVRLSAPETEYDGTATYLWEQLAGPAVSMGDDPDPSVPMRTFTVPWVEDRVQFVFRVTVFAPDSVLAQDAERPASEDTAKAEKTFTINVNPNLTPEAGDDQEVFAGDEVVLQGSAMVGNVTFQWTQTAGPVVELQAADSATASFIAPDVDTETNLVFTLAASKNDATATDEVTVIVHPDIQDVGTDVELVIEASVTEGVAPLSVTFSVSTLNGESLSDGVYLWDFGDGATAEGQQVTHTFSSSGTFLVTACLTLSTGLVAGCADKNITPKPMAGTTSGGGGPPPPANAAPSVSDQTTQTLQDVATTLTLNGSDSNGDDLTFSIVSGPSHGSLGPLDNTASNSATVLYTPAAGYSGSDSFTFKASDGTADSGTATLTMTISAANEPPVAAADSYSVNEDSSLTVDAASGVLANDTDGDNDPLTAILVSGVSHGTLALSANGSFTYTPAADYVGADAFTYKANDGSADSNTVTVTITVNAVNDAPSFTAPADQAMALNDTLVVSMTNVSPGPANEAGQTVTFTATSSDQAVISDANLVFAGSQLTITSVAATGVVTITVVAQDSGGTANGGVNTSSPRTFDVVAGGFTISGTISRPIAGGGMGPFAGVSLTFTGTGTSAGQNATATTDTNGDYAAMVPIGWSGDVTATDADSWVLNPASQSYADLAANQSNQDCTGVRNYYVDKPGDSLGDDGNDGFQGTSVAPLATVQKACKLALPGDSVLIRSGIYTERDIQFAVSGESGYPITVSAESGHEGNVILQTKDTPGGARGIFTLHDVINTPPGYGYYIFRNLVMRNAIAGFWLGSENGRVHDLLIENVEFYDCQCAMKVSYMGAERVIVRDCVSHDCFSDDGAFNFQVSNQLSVPGSGSRQVVFLDNQISDNPHQRSSGIIFQEQCQSSILIGNESFNNGQYSYTSKAGGHHIWLNNKGFNNGKGVFYLNGPLKDYGTGQIINAPPANYILLNNVCIGRMVTEGGTLINWWRPANLWFYNNTCVSLMTTGTSNTTLNSNGSFVTYSYDYLTTGYAKNNLFYKANGYSVQWYSIIYNEGGVIPRRYLADHNLHYSVGLSSNDVAYKIAGQDINGTEVYNVNADFNGWKDWFLVNQGDPVDANSLWNDPGFVGLDSTDDTKWQDLHLDAGSPAINSGEPFGESDDDFPAKIEDFLAAWNWLNDFDDHILTPGAKATLLARIRTAYQYDIDGNLRDAQPDIGAYERP